MTSACGGSWWPTEKTIFILWFQYGYNRHYLFFKHTWKLESLSCSTYSCRFYTLVSLVSLQVDSSIWLKPICQFAICQTINAIIEANRMQLHLYFILIRLLAVRRNAPMFLLLHFCLISKLEMETIKHWCLIIQVAQLFYMNFVCAKFVLCPCVKCLALHKLPEDIAVTAWIQDQGNIPKPFKPVMGYKMHIPIKGVNCMWYVKLFDKYNYWFYIVIICSTLNAAPKYVFWWITLSKWIYSELLPLRVYVDSLWLQNNESGKQDG